MLITFLVFLLGFFVGAASFWIILSGVIRVSRKRTCAVSNAEVDAPASHSQPPAREPIFYSDSGRYLCENRVVEYSAEYGGDGGHRSTWEVYSMDELPSDPYWSFHSREEAVEFMKKMDELCRRSTKRSAKK